MTDPAMLQRQVDGLTALLDVEREARDAASPAALAFLMVNRTRAVLPYDNAACWSTEVGTLRIDAVSNVSEVDGNGPYATWLKAQIRALDDNAVRAVTGAWTEAPPHALWCPIPGLVLFRHQPWRDSERLIAERLAATYAHARNALTRNASPWRWRAPGRRLVLAGTALALAALAFPIRQSAVAPATVVARAPMAVTAPMDGIIGQIEVEPYDEVAAGQILVRLDATQAKGRLQVAQNAEKVAAADLLKTRQRAFSDGESSARLSGAEAQLEVHRSEAAYAEELLDRTLIKAKGGGMVLFDDPQDWTGRPVAVGERIMVLADSAHVMLQISLPADDAFVLRPGAEVSFFLNVDALHQIDAKLTHVAYEANMAADGFLAYRLNADFAAGQAAPRIGLRGTATIYGDRVSLARFVFRRPLAVLRRLLRL